MKFGLTIILFTVLTSCHGQTSNVTAIKTEKVTNTNTVKSHEPIHENNGIVYFSFDSGNTWEDKSIGLPENISLTDIAVSACKLLQQFS